MNDTLICGTFNFTFSIYFPFLKIILFIIILFYYFICIHVYYLIVLYFISLFIYFYFIYYCLFLYCFILLLCNLAQEFPSGSIKIYLILSYRLIFFISCAILL